MALTVSWNCHIYVRLPISILLLKERNKLSYLSHYHLKMFCFVGSILISTGTRLSITFPLALGHVIASTGNCLLLARVYLNPAHPLEDGSNPTSHRRPAFHFLP